MMIAKDREVFFKCKDLALALGYSQTRKAIISHIPEESKYKLSDLQSREGHMALPSGAQPHTIMTNKAGAISLIVKSNLPAATDIVLWVADTLVPSLARTSFVAMDRRGLPRTRVLVTTDERELHEAVVRYIRGGYPYALITPGLCENQDSEEKRRESYRKGYTKGQCDLMIENYHPEYRGLCIELKTPQGNGVLSPKQRLWLKARKANGFKCVVTCDYHVAIKKIDNYMAGTRIKCSICNNNEYKLKTPESLRRLEMGFHRRCTAIVSYE